MAETSEWDAALSMHVQGLSISPQKDLGFAELARRKFEFAEHEMFGMMVALTEFDPKYPVEGVDFYGSSYITIQTSSQRCISGLSISPLSFLPHTG